MVELGMEPHFTDGHDGLAHTESWLREEPNEPVDQTEPEQSAEPRAPIGTIKGIGHVCVGEFPRNWAATYRSRVIDGEA